METTLSMDFEVVVILIDWMVLIVSGVLVSVVFKRAGRDAFVHRLCYCLPWQSD